MTFTMYADAGCYMRWCDVCALVAFYAAGAPMVPHECEGK